MREVAKFLSGFMFCGLLNHLWLAFHSELMPIKVWGMTLTSGLNSFGILFHIAVTAVLIYYAWFSAKRTVSGGLRQRMSRA